MSDHPNKLSNFLQELKRRKVIKLSTMYAATAFILLEAVDIIAPALMLPSWTTTLVIVLLSVGFPIAVILSWLFDITPEGVRKTEMVKETAEPEASEELEPARKLLKTSNIIIALLLVAVCILLYPKIFKKDKLSEFRDEEGMISLAVLPFDNLTGDSSLYFWQNGISEYLINSLGNSDQLAVSSSQVVSDVLEGTRQVNTASLSPDIAMKTASKVNASTYITGNFIGKEKDVSIMLNLVNTENGGLIWSTRVNGDLGDSYRSVLDNLSDTVRNYLEIKAMEEEVEADLTNAYPNSSEAYMYYIDGLNAFMDSQYKTAIESLLEAYEIDTTFTFAAFYLAFTYNFSGQINEEMIHWIRRAHELKENLPPVYRPWIEMWYACFVTEDIDDIQRYCDLMYGAAFHSRLLLFDLAVTYYSFMDDYEKSIRAFQKIEALNELWQDEWRFQRYYWEYSWALLQAGKPEEAKRFIEKGLEINPDNGGLIILKGSMYVMKGDTVTLNRYMEHLWALAKEKGFTEAEVERGIGIMYVNARDSLNAAEHFRRAYELDPERYNSLWMLLECQINSNHNIEECLRLSRFGNEKTDRIGFRWLEGICLHKLGRNEEALAILRELDEKWLGYNKYLKSDIKDTERALALQAKK